MLNTVHSTVIRYSNEVIEALEIAEKIGKENKNSSCEGAHLLKAMLTRDLSLLKSLESRGIDVYYLEEWADVRIEEMPKINGNFSCKIGESIHQVILEAESVREQYKEDEVSLFHLFTALASPGVAFNFDQMKTFPVSRNELLSALEKTLVPSNETSLKMKLPDALSRTFIQKYCIHKKEDIKNRKERDLLIGIESEIHDIIEILCRLHKQNVLIIGDPGVGKSTLLEGLIQKVLIGHVPDALVDMEVFQLDLGAFIGGASYKGEVEDRLKNLSQEIRQYPKSILIIEELHALLGGSQTDSGMVSILKSELSKGLTIVCTSTIEEYTKKIEKEQGLINMFEILKLQEKDDNIHFRMLQQTGEDYQNHHGITMDDESIYEAIRLSKRYLKEKSLPASAINLIDHTMSSLKIARELFLKEKEYWITKISDLESKVTTEDSQRLFTEAQWVLDDIRDKSKYLIQTYYEQVEEEICEFLIAEDILNYTKKYIEKAEKIAQEKRSHITPVDLAWVISKKTNIPVGKLKNEEREKLKDIESVLAQRVIGQDSGIAMLSEAILESRSGLSKAGQPIGSFFFSGPTGTGKTELAKSLAEFLFQDENAIIRFDMSEFKEEHSAALLYGAPPGYVGYEEGGLLVNKIRQKPYSILLFDEIEKAHPSVFDVFLQIMDEGKLHDRLGKEGDFSNAIILFTSNIGAEFITAYFEKENTLPVTSDMMEIMSRHFRPEFLARLTEIVPFAPISRDNVLKIFEIHLKKELLDLARRLHIEIDISPQVKEFLSTESYDIKYGARPIKGIIRSRLRRPLARKLIAGEYKEGDHIKVDLQNKKLVWKKCITENIKLIK